LVGSATLIPPLLATASGDVLELGPGSGEQVQYFRAASSAKRIYGAEPCVPLHDDLRANATRHGLADKYRIVDAGAERETLIPGLAKAGLLESKSPGSGVFDTIVCVRVLCSVKDLHETTETIYHLLKPGGKLVICEHTVNPCMSGHGSWLARFFQSVYTLLGWSFFVGNCHLTRDIRSAVEGAARSDGEWSRNDLKDNFGHSVLPYVAGTLVKRSS
jgi:SAM-dependent methyltransferase